MIWSSVQAWTSTPNSKRLVCIPVIYLEDPEMKHSKVNLILSPTKTECFPLHFFSLISQPKLFILLQSNLNFCLKLMSDKVLALQKALSLSLPKLPIKITCLILI